LGNSICQQYAVGTNSGRFKVGEDEARLKRGALQLCHHTQPTVISTFDQAEDMATKVYVPEIMA